MMGYVPLSTVYYKNNEMYKSEYMRRYQSEYSVTFDFDVHGNKSFYVQTPEILRMTTSILSTDKKVTLLKNSLPGVAIEQFTSRCLIDEILLTNQIEGVRSTRRELYEVLGDLEKAAGEHRRQKRFWTFVRQYKKLESGEDIPLRTCEDIRDLYDDLVLDEVMQENPGNKPDGIIFRKGSTSVESMTGKELHRGVYPEERIIRAMNQALTFLWDENVLLLQRVSIFHYLMEYIHPFYDGNGRIGRFIISYLLAQELDPLLAFRLSYTIADNISEYYKAFSVCNDKKSLGDLTPFLLMMLEMICKSTINLKQALEQRNTRLKRYVAIIPTLPGANAIRTRRAYDMLIQAGLFSEHGVTIKELSSFLNCSDSTARKEIRIIAQSNLLKVNKGNANEKCYELNTDIIDEIILNS